MQITENEDPVIDNYYADGIGITMRNCGIDTFCPWDHHQLVLYKQIKSKI